MYLVFVVETCGLWDGDAPYHFTTTASDEAYVIMGYLLISCLTFIRLMNALLGWTMNADGMSGAKWPVLYDSPTGMLFCYCYDTILMLL